MPRTALSNCSSIWPSPMTNWKPSALPPSNGDAVDRAREVDRHAVAGGRGSPPGRCWKVRRCLRRMSIVLSTAASPTSVDTRSTSAGARSPILNLGIDLESRVERHLALGRVRLLGDSRGSGDAQLGLVDRVGEDLAHLVVQHLAVHRVAVALRDHAHRHLARPEAVGRTVRTRRRRRDSTSELIVAAGQRERDPALELVERFNVDGHGRCCAFVVNAGARGRTRTDTPVKASGPKPGASTNFATRARGHRRPPLGRSDWRPVNQLV